MTSVSSVNSSLTRRSGLSEPYRRIASVCVITGKAGMSTPITFLNVLRIIPSNIVRISSSSRKEVSTSIWVNSG